MDNDAVDVFCHGLRYELSSCGINLCFYEPIHTHTHTHIYIYIYREHK